MWAPGPQPGSVQATLSCNGSCLRGDRFRLLGVGYSWLVASIEALPGGSEDASEQMEGRFGGGRSHHHSLRDLHSTTTVARADIGAVERTVPSGA